MSGKMRIVAKPDCRGGYLHLSRQGHGGMVAEWSRDSWAATFFGITEPGTYEMTVEKVEATWPWVRLSDHTVVCGACNLYSVDTERATRPPRCERSGCKVLLSGEVPQSKVADFLRQEA